MDPFTLKKLAGHADLNTTMRYVHPNDEDVRAAMEKEQRGHKNGHNTNSADSEGRDRTALTIAAVRN